MIKQNLKLLKDVEKIALEAGQIILSLYKQDNTIHFKSDMLPFTEADKKAHEIIVRRLKNLNPKVPIISEEDLKENYYTNELTQYWLIDPLDGTKEFINQNGEFTVNIALINLGFPTLGVVYAPALGITYLASKGHGAFKRQINQNNPNQIYVRKKSQQFKIVTSRSHRDKLTNLFIKKSGFNEVLECGSSLKFCIVAEGLADIYPRFGTTSHWDTAAAQCILEEAGGLVFDINGKRLCYKHSKNKLNPFFIASGIADIKSLISTIQSLKKEIPARVYS